MTPVASEATRTPQIEAASSSSPSATADSCPTTPTKFASIGVAAHKLDMARAASAAAGGHRAIVLATTEGSPASLEASAEGLLGVHIAHIALSRSVASRLAAPGAMSSLSRENAALLDRWARAVLADDVGSIAESAGAAVAAASVSRGCAGDASVESALDTLASGPPALAAASSVGAKSVALGASASRWVIADARAFAVGEDFSGLHHALRTSANVKFVLATGAPSVLHAAAASFAAGSDADSSAESATSAAALPLSVGLKHVAADAAAELRRVKDAGLWTMEHGSAFVASCAPAADGGVQLQRALDEAASFNGPALVLVLDPRAAPEAASAESLTAHPEESAAVDVAVATAAVDSGAWPLYRWNPSLDSELGTKLSASPPPAASAAAAAAESATSAPRAAAGLSPALAVDSPCVLRDLEAFVSRQNHLSLLAAASPEFDAAASGMPAVAVSAHDTAEKRLLGSFKRLASAVGGPGGEAKEQLLVLYGSDGGNAAGVAKRLGDEAARRGFDVDIKPADDVDPTRLVEAQRLLFVVSTAGQGEQPLNSKEFVARLMSTDQPMLDGLQVGVVGLGDSHYWPRPDQAVYYNKAAKDVFARLSALGVSHLASLCLCDEQDDDGFEEALKDWVPQLWAGLGVARASDLESHDGDGELASAEPVHRSDEDIKRGSNFLRGTLATSLVDPTTGAIPFEDTKLTKFSGIYMQDDRDLRTARRKAGLEPAYSFMVRARMPGGVVSADQWLAFDRLSDTHGNGTFKLTTRQAFQLHGVIKSKLKATIKAINARLMDTIAACGDVNRNVMVSALPQLSSVHAQVVAIADSVSAHLKPHAGSRAYHEVFLDRKLVAGGAMSASPESEPIYGPTYLPRKFKISFAVPPVNDVDVYAHCLNFVAIVEHDDEPEATSAAAAAAASAGEGVRSSSAVESKEGEHLPSTSSADIEDGLASRAPGADRGAHTGRVLYAEPSAAERRQGGRLVGFNIIVGGGMGMTHGNTKTFPRLGELLGFCTPDQVNAVAEHCATVQRDFGDRVNRKHARLKYTIDDRGISWYRNEVESRLGFRLQEPRAFEFTTRGDAFGWAAGEDGKMHLTLFIQNGRVRDDPGCRAKTALRKVASMHPSLKFVLTANQNVVVSNVLPSMRSAIDAVLADHGLSTSGFSGLRLNSVACVALPSKSPIAGLGKQGGGFRLRLMAG